MHLQDPRNIIMSPKTTAGTVGFVLMNFCNNNFMSTIWFSNVSCYHYGNILGRFLGRLDTSIVPMWSSCVCMYVCMYVGMYLSMYLCMYNIHVCIYVCMYVCIYECILYMYVCMYVDVDEPVTSKILITYIEGEILWSLW